MGPRCGISDRPRCAWTPVAAAEVMGGVGCGLLGVAGCKRRRCSVLWPSWRCPPGVSAPGAGSGGMCRQAVTRDAGTWMDEGAGPSASGGSRGGVAYHEARSEHDLAGFDAALVETVGHALVHRSRHTRTSDQTSRGKRRTCGLSASPSIHRPPNRVGGVAPQATSRPQDRGASRSSSSAAKSRAGSRPMPVKWPASSNDSTPCRRVQKVRNRWRASGEAGWPAAQSRWSSR